MQMLSDDDLNIRTATDEELDAAWDLWFELAQSTNDDDPSHTHGVFLDLSKVAAEERQTAANPHDRLRSFDR